MNDSPTIQARRRLLKEQVKSIGQAEASRRAQKPDRQIGDLIAGRVSFGDRVAKDLEKIRPDLPQGWLVFPEQPQESKPRAISSYDQVVLAALSAREQEIAYQIQELTKIWVQVPAEQRAEILRTIKEAAPQEHEGGTEVRKNKNSIKQHKDQSGLG